jgi:hypothetical protein
MVIAAARYSKILKKDSIPARLTTNLYLETKYWYKCATYEEVILKVKSSYDYTKEMEIFD